jgi:hypothetical protein
MPRYTRDEIIIQGIELSASPTVIQHDIPGGILQPNAYAIKWLQNALDMFHNKFPFSGDVQSTSITLPVGSHDIYLTGSPSVYLPTDYILDIRNGIIINYNNQLFRLKRVSFQDYLSADLSNQNITNAVRPSCYTKINERFKFTPLITSALTGTLWYFAMPALLDYNDYPAFPDEQTLIEFIRLKALEWTRSIEVGTAVAYMNKELARFRADGLLDDAEYDVAPLENNQVIQDGQLFNRNNWMGRTVL